MLVAVNRILSSNPVLVERGLTETESEQIVIAAVSASRPSGAGKALTRLEIYTSGSEKVSGESERIALEFATARAAGHPLQHLTGYQVFLDHVYGVGPEVLVPRPETELLVVTAIEHLLRIYGETGPKLGLEVGVGSGAISIEMLSRFSHLRMLGSELSEGAITRAVRNAESILDRSENLRVLKVDQAAHVLEPFELELRGETKADFLISNPPYLIEEDPIDDDVRRHEPPQALFAPAHDPVHFYRQIAQRAARLLKPEGAVFLELPSSRAAFIRRLFMEAGWTAELHKDLPGKDRILVAIHADAGNL